MYNLRLSNLRLFLQNEPNFVYRNKSLAFACGSDAARLVRESEEPFACIEAARVRQGLALGKRSPSS